MNVQLIKKQYEGGSFEKGFHVIVNGYSYGMFTPGFMEYSEIDFFKRHLNYAKEKLLDYKNFYLPHNNGNFQTLSNYDWFKYHYKLAVIFAACLKLWRENKIFISAEYISSK